MPGDPVSACPVFNHVSKKMTSAISRAIRTGGRTGQAAMTEKKA